MKKTIPKNVSHRILSLTLPTVCAGLILAGFLLRAPFLRRAGLLSGEQSALFPLVGSHFA